MPSKRKKSKRARKKEPQLNRGPFACRDLEQAIGRDGWRPAKNRKHLNFEHPTKRGKVSLDAKWTGIRANDTMFRSVARQAGLASKALLLLLNGIDP